MKTNFTWPKNFRLVRIFAIVIATVAITSYLDLHTDLFDGLEQQAYSDRMKVDCLRQPQYEQDAESQIRVVSIDDTSYRVENGSNPGSSVLPRTCYAKLISKLTRFGAKAIVFDMLFDTHSNGDQQLAHSIQSSGRVVFACGDEGPPTNLIIHPEQLFQHSGCYIGHSRVPLSSESESIDRVSPAIMDGSGFLPALSIEAVRLADGMQNKPLTHVGDRWIVPGLQLQTIAGGDFNIHYVGSEQNAFPLTPIQNVVNSPSRLMDSFYTNYFRNKIVVVGDVTRDHNDIKVTPLGLMPGVIVNANAIATLLDNAYFQEASPQIEILVMLCLALASALLVIGSRFTYGAFLLVALFIVFATTNVYVFTEHLYYLHLVGPSSTILVSGLFVILERGLTEESEKKKMRALLQRYVNPKMANYLIVHPELIGKQGKRVVGTVLFSDISGFTALSEQLTPEELVIRMNEYFHTILEIVFRHDGTAASIAGDAMLAVFGVPVPTSNHASQAAQAAIEIREAALALGQKWKKQDLANFDVGIGINTGEMVVGEVGGEHLRNFSVYGLQVNIASRIQGLTKVSGGAILISRSTCDAIRTVFVVDGPSLRAIKGVAEPVEIFRLTGRINSPVSPETTGISTYRTNIVDPIPVGEKM